MSLTEDEAKKKWCPYARPEMNVGDFNQGDKWVAGGNRAPNGQAIHNTRCIGSECMSWRWFDTVSDDGTACHMKPTAHVKRHPDNNPAEAHPLERRRGYCGLAGAP